MKLFKHQGIWYIYGRKNGKRIRVSTRTRNRKEAECILHEYTSNEKIPFFIQSI